MTVLERNKMILDLIFSDKEPEKLTELYAIVRTDSDDDNGVIEFDEMIEFSDEYPTDLNNKDIVKCVSIYSRMKYYECDEFINILLFIDGYWYNIEASCYDCSMHILKEVQHTSWAYDLMQMGMLINTGSMNIDVEL